MPEINNLWGITLLSLLGCSFSYASYKFYQDFNQLVQVKKDLED